MGPSTRRPSGTAQMQEWQARGVDSFVVLHDRAGDGWIEIAVEIQLEQVGRIIRWLPGPNHALGLAKAQLVQIKRVDIRLDRAPGCRRQRSRRCARAAA